MTAKDILRFFKWMAIIGIGGPALLVFLTWPVIVYQVENVCGAKCVVAEFGWIVILVSFFLTLLDKATE